MADTEVHSVAELALDEAAEARFDAAAEADYKAGRVVPHERVMEWLDKLAKGERAPRPRA